MSEKGSEPDIEPLGLNVAEVPTPDISGRPRYTPRLFDLYSGLRVATRVTANPGRNSRLGLGISTSTSMT